MSTDGPHRALCRAGRGRAAHHIGVTRSTGSCSAAESARSASSFAPPSCPPEVMRCVVDASSTLLKRPPAFSTAASTVSRSSARKETPETQSTTPARAGSSPSASGSSAPRAALSWIQDGRTTGKPRRRAHASLRERGVTPSATRCVVWSVRSGVHTPLSAATDASSRRRAS
eukprot:scaffold46312_cov60-Phaeocystis_antarctica.AAC.1